MKRLLAVIDSFGLGGAETQLAAVTRVLTESGRYECLACSILPPQSAEAHFAEAVGRVYLGKGSRMAVPRVLHDLIGVIRTFRPDVIYSRLPMANGLARLASRMVGGHLPHVAGIDTVPQMYTLRYALQHPGSLVFRWLERRADRIVCNSQATADAVIARGYPLDRVSVIPNGIDCDYFQPPASRAAAGIFRLVCVASLRPEKGVARLIETLAPLLQRERAALRIVGDGETRGDVERTITRLGVSAHVTLVGAVRDIRSELHSADLFVTAAYVEGFGIAVAEAGATGLPVVAFAVPGGLKEVLLDGVTGYLVPDQDDAAFRHAVEELGASRDLRARLGEAARRHIVTRYGLRTVAGGLDSCFGAR